MALYALAGGFLNAYNSSEAAKRLSAAEREKEARKIAREDFKDKRERARYLADLNAQRAYAKAEKARDRAYQEEQTRLSNLRQDTKLEDELILARAKETRESNRQRNRVIYQALAGVAQNQENTPLSNRALALLGIFTEPYLVNPAFDITSLGPDFLESFKNLTLQIMPQLSSAGGAPNTETTVSFNGGAGAAGNPNPGINPRPSIPGRPLSR